MTTDDENTVRLYGADTAAIPPAERERLAASLDEHERARQVSFVREDDRALFGAAHGLLRWCLSLSLLPADAEGGPGVPGWVPPEAWRFAANALGKPHAGAPPGVRAPSFSLSHTRGATVVAVAGGGHVGVDVERCDRVVAANELAERYFAPEERAVLAAEPDGTARRELFFRYWTLKEAYLKALGVGLSRPLSGVAFARPAEETALLYDHEGDATGWRFVTRALPDGCVASVAFRPPAGQLRLRCFRHENGRWLAV